MKNYAITVLILSTTFFISTLSYAETSALAFSGHWSGTGTAVTQPSTLHSTTRNCSEISLSLNQSNKELELQTGTYTCQDLQASYDPAQFDLKEGQVWYQGAQIGTITDNLFEITYVAQDDGSVFKLTLTLNGNTLQYQEDWFNSPTDPAIQMEVRGSLKR